MLEMVDVPVLSRSNADQLSRAALRLDNCFVTAQYEEEGRIVHVFATHSRILPAC